MSSSASAVAEVAHSTPSTTPAAAIETYRLNMFSNPRLDQELTNPVLKVAYNAPHAPVRQRVAGCARVSCGLRHFPCGQGESLAGYRVGLKPTRNSGISITLWARLQPCWMS